LPRLRYCNHLSHLLRERGVAVPPESRASKRAMRGWTAQSLSVIDRRKTVGKSPDPFDH
jgi:hypothetical protein